MRLGFSSRSLSIAARQSPSSTKLAVRSPRHFHPKMSDVGSDLSISSPRDSPHELQAAWLSNDRAREEEGKLPQGDQGAATEETDWSAVRGRTNRKRSNAQQHYVCVVVWLVEPDQDSPATQKVWDQVQDVRRRYDQAYRRWLPHVTLIPPFIVPFQQPSKESSDRNGRTDADVPHTSPRPFSDGLSTLRSLAVRIEDLCQGLTARPITFNDWSKFTLRRYDTFHLRPKVHSSATTSLVQLQEQLVRRLPEAVSYSRRAMDAAKSGRRRQSYNSKPQQTSPPVGESRADSGDLTFKPHLTLGQAIQKDKSIEIEQLASELTDSSASEEHLLRVTLGSIQLMYKPVQQSGPYEIFQSFPLRPQPPSSQPV